MSSLTLAVCPHHSHLNYFYSITLPSHFNSLLFHSHCNLSFLLQLSHSNSTPLKSSLLKIPIPTSSLLRSTFNASLQLLKFKFYSHFSIPVQRLPVTITVSIGMFLLGTASATNIKVLVNQDSVWAYAAILSGCLLTFMVLRYGVLSFREKLYNKYGLGDWPLPLIWVFLIM